MSTATSAQPTIVKPTALQRGASSAIVPRVEVEGLTEWDVYGDEAGGLPLRDSDDAFVTAAFAVPRSVGLELMASGRLGASRPLPGRIRVTRPAW